MLLPGISSENRDSVPIGFVSPDVIAGDNTWIVPLASLFHFGVLTSQMHMCWMKLVGGRLESRYQYSASIVYNNFAWPLNPTKKQIQAVEVASQEVLDARSQFPAAALSDLYDPNCMPANLLKAHQKLDKAVDAAYGKTTFKTEADRVAFLFELYQQYVGNAGKGAK